MHAQTFACQQFSHIAHGCHSFVVRGDECCVSQGICMCARSLVPSPLKDDTSMGGLLWSHNSVQGKCGEKIQPPHCWVALFSRFPLDF
eukprot:COSAG02_NODE_4728_length_5045_cov_9.058835_5_plen_88_part_00